MIEESEPLNRPSSPTITTHHAMLVVHLLLVLAIGVWVWRLSIALAAMGGATSAVAPTLSLMTLIGPTAVANTLAAMHLGTREHRAHHYLMMATAWGWVQILSVATFFYWVPLLLVLLIPVGLLMIGITGAALWVTDPEGDKPATWRTNLLDIGVGVGALFVVLATAMVSMNGLFFFS